MKTYTGKDIRNVGVVGHGHCGKTMLTSAMLYTSGATARLLRPDDSNTLTDFDEEEIDRKFTISTGIAFAEWHGVKINLLDTPGFSLFLEDTKSALLAADGALVIVDGVSGVEVITEKVQAFTDDFHMPHAFVINKLDRERASFERAVESIHARFGRSAVPIQLPIGAEKSFCGLIDLLAMKAYKYTPGGDGKGGEIPIPDGLASAADEAHRALVEIVAEGKDELMEEFFEAGTLAEEHMVAGLHEAIEQDKLFPVLCVSAAQNIGMDKLLDFIAEHSPSPLYHGKVFIGGHDVEREVSDSVPASAYVFKTMADPFAGRVSYFKLYSGVLKNDDHLLNMRSQSDERLSHIGAPKGKAAEPVSELHAGDIGVVPKLKDTLTGDTLAPKSSPIAYPSPSAPEPPISYAIVPRSRNDEDRMGSALARILEEDRCLRFYRDPQTQEFLLAGNGQQHLEVIVSRLKRRYGVDVELHSPKIPYRETIRGKAEVQGRHKKQTGGHGQFGDCWIRMEPLPRGEKFSFANEIFGGAVPRQYVPAIEKGIQEAAANGYLAGFPVVDFKVTVFDGSYHDVDSSEMAFKLAARKAFKAAMALCKPVLLEPVMQVETHAPVEYAGDLLSDFNSRRGRVTGMDSQGGVQLIRAQVPMAEMLSYQNDLVARTQGRASFSMAFDHYDFVPAGEAEKIVAASKNGKRPAGEDEE